MSQKSFNRSERVAQLIHHAIATIILRHTEKPYFGGVTVTYVKLARDLAHAKIFVTVLDDKVINETITSLNKEAKFLRHLLAQELNLRIVPQLVFAYDTSISDGQKLSALIDQAVTKDVEHKNAVSIDDQEER